MATIMVSKVKGDPWRFIGAQNVCKFFMFGLTIELLMVQWYGALKSKSWSVQDRNYNHSAQNYLLRWSLFLPCLNS